MSSVDTDRASRLSRRDFLKIGVILSADMLLSSCGPLLQNPDTEEKILHLSRMDIQNKTHLGLFFNQANIAGIISEYLYELDLLENSPNKPLVIFTPDKPIPDSDFDYLNPVEITDRLLAGPIITIKSEMQINDLKNTNDAVVLKVSKEFSTNLVLALSIWGRKRGIYTTENVKKIVVNYVGGYWCQDPQLLPILVSRPFPEI